jgi:hypothetical protein
MDDAIFFTVRTTAAHVDVNPPQQLHIDLQDVTLPAVFRLQANV